MPTALVTGANRGIGLELARQLKKDGWEVIATTRKPSPDLDAVGVRVETLDVEDEASIRSLAERIGDKKLDLLINNAGIMLTDDIDSAESGEVRKQLEVNALGPLLVTLALRRNLGRGSKVGIVTSRMGSIADNTSGGMYGYRMSKAAVNAAGVSLANDLKGQGVTVLLLHPGFVRTDLTAGNGMIDPPEAAAGLLQRIAEARLEDTGSFLHMNGERLPW